MVQIASMYVPFETRGRVMSLLTLSYVVGEAVARSVLGAIISSGVTWQEVPLARVHD